MEHEIQVGRIQRVKISKKIRFFVGIKLLMHAVIQFSHKWPGGLQVAVIPTLGLKVGYCPPLTNSWIITIMWLCIALTRTPDIDCFWGGSTQPQGL